MRRLSRDGHGPLRQGQRTCSHCRTVLSSYNPTAECWPRSRWGDDPLIEAQGERKLLTKLELMEMVK